MNATTAPTAPITPAQPNTNADAICAVRADIQKHLIFARNLRALQSDTTGMERHGINLDLRAIGNGSYWHGPAAYDLPPARYLYLALAFLRGRSLDTVEGSRPVYQDIDMHACPIIRRTNPLDAARFTKALGRYLTAEQYKAATGSDDPKYGTNDIRNSPVEKWLGDSINWGNYKRLEAKAA